MAGPHFLREPQGAAGPRPRTLGRVLLFADVDIISDGTVSSGDGTTGSNEIFLANLFAYADRNRPVANDFNGDGHGDIPWRDTGSGKTVIQFFEDFVEVASGGIGTLPAPIWDTVGTGDFDRDRRADILWRHTGTGDTIIRRMEGFAKVAAQSIGGVPAQWHVQ